MLKSYLPADTHFATPRFHTVSHRRSCPLEAIGMGYAAAEGRGPQEHLRQAEDVHEVEWDRAMTDDQTKCRRPTAYTKEIGERVFDHLYREGIRSVWADPDMPDKATFYRWLREHKEFRKVYAFACTCRADDLCDDIYEILFEEGGEPVERVRGGRIVRTSPSAHDLALSRIRIDVRKWVITRLKSHAQLLEQKEIKE